jgi:hypothetical protein
MALYKCYPFLARNILVNLSKTVFLLVSASILLVTSSARAQQLVKDVDRIKSADDFVRMLADSASGPYLDAVLKARDAWRKALEVEQAAWSTLTQAINTAAERKDIMSKVTFESLPETGATVQYQTEDERRGKVRPTTVNEKTRAVQEMHIGYYFIWAARGENDKTTATTDPDAQYAIVEKVEPPIQLKEEEYHPKGGH